MFLFTSFYSCNNDFENELEELRNEIKLNRQLIEKLNTSLTITFIEDIENGYKIHFSDSSTIIIENGQIPLLEIGSNGNWFINNVDSGVNAIGQDGNNAPNIVGIIHSEEGFIFYFSDDTIIEIPTNPNIKKIACWGDSLTAGNRNYPGYLQALLGNDYEVLMVELEDKTH